MHQTENNDQSIIPDCCEKHTRLGMVDFSVAIAARAHARVADLILDGESAETLDGYVRALKNTYDAISIHYYLASRLQGCDQIGSVDGEIPTTLDDQFATGASDGNSDLEDN